MTVDEMFPRKYARGQDLNGKPVRVTIREVKAEMMRPGGSAPVRKWVVYFVETEKGVVLCRTLAEQIAHAAGSDDTVDWADKLVELYPQPMTVAGVARLAIRARPVNGA